MSPYSNAYVIRAFHWFLISEMNCPCYRNRIMAMFISNNVSAGICLFLDTTCAVCVCLFVQFHLFGCPSDWFSFWHFKTKEYRGMDLEVRQRKENSKRRQIVPCRTKSGDRTPIRGIVLRHHQDPYYPTKDLE